MYKLSIEFRKCYGIKRLEHVFEFETNQNTHVIYAQNWLMKSSFAKTFEDISKWFSPKDRITNEDWEFELKIDDQLITNEQKKKIYVIKSEPISNSNPDKITNLLVNNQLKLEYEEELKKIEANFMEILWKLKDMINTRSISDVKNRIVADFWIGNTDSDIIGLLLSLKEEIDEVDIRFKNLDYKKVFVPQVKSFLDKNDVRQLLNQFNQKYQEYVRESKFFKNWFDSGRANEILKSLKENKFFAAEHKIALKNKKDEDESAQPQIFSYEEFQTNIDEEKERILQQPELRESFDKITELLKKNKELVEFKEYMLENQRVVELISGCEYKQLLRKFRVGCLVGMREDYDNFIQLFEESKERIKQILESANVESSKRNNILIQYKDIFLPPFDLEIWNQQDAIVGIKKPIVKFYYNKWGLRQEKNSWDLREVLSNWERRVFYLLNILFDIHNLIEEWEEFTIIADDIADSFDYRNKYWIIEYLRELSENNKIHMIVLTHNFDFYRTVQSRLYCNREKNCRMTSVDCDWKILLYRADYLDAFKKFRQNHHNNKAIFIATIPFVRNLVQYSKWVSDEDFKNLSRALHIKSDSNTLNLWNIKTIFEKYIVPNNALSTDFLATENVIKFIKDIADEIVSNPAQWACLESKIVLAIASRLFAEEYMINKIKGHEPGFNTDELWRDPTFWIYAKYCSITLDNIKIFKRVLLTTSETIHLNSFMYEPLIDMSMNELVKLYQDVKFLS